MTKFVDAKVLATETGIPMRSIAQMAYRGRFGFIRPTRRLLLINVEEFKAYLASTTVARKIVEEES